MVLRNPDISEGFEVWTVEGLGPVRADVITNPYATDDGAYYASSRVNTRNIVLTLGFRDNSKIENVRLKSYRYFPVKDTVRLTIETDIRVSEIYGVVESNEPSIFSNQESTQISIICPQPYFYDVGNGGMVITDFSSVEPNFEFPFENLSTTVPTIEVGILNLNTFNNVYYEGSVSTGVTIQLHANGMVDSDISIHNVTTQTSMTLRHEIIWGITGGAAYMEAGDSIIIVTNKGAKEILALRDGIYHNAINALDVNSDWLQIDPGDNVFTYSTGQGQENLQVMLAHQVLHQGV